MSKTRPTNRWLELFWQFLWELSRHYNCFLNFVNTLKFLSRQGDQPRLVAQPAHPPRRARDLVDERARRSFSQLACKQTHRTWPADPRANHGQVEFRSRQSRQKCSLFRSQEGAKFFLASNAWNCNCHNIKTFQEFLLKYNGIIMDGDKMRCEEYSGKALEQVDCTKLNQISI